MHLTLNVKGNSPPSLAALNPCSQSETQQPLPWAGEAKTAAQAVASGTTNAVFVLLPRELLERVQLITPAFMEARGLQGLMLDIDNTLVPHGELGDVLALRDWLEPLRVAGIELRLVSNALPRRITYFSIALEIAAVGSGRTAGKPFPRAFRSAIREMQLEPHRVAMIGDQVFSDVLGANLAGAYPILVRPLSDNSLPHTRVARALERLVLHRAGFDW